MRPPQSEHTAEGSPFDQSFKSLELDALDAVQLGDKRAQDSAGGPVKDIAANISSARTDAELDAILGRHKDATVVVNFGSSFCPSCRDLFPHFYRLTAQFPGLKYAVAQIDYMHESLEGIEYTPTFRVLHGGKTVDQFYGASREALRDHLWLHSD